MRQITEFLSTKVAQTKIKAIDENIKKIVKDELDRLGHTADLNHIDVSEVIDMNSLFSCVISDLGGKYKDLNPDISKWNVSNVEDMSFMFYSCENFNCDISGWNVSNVKHMNHTFEGCRKFNQDLSRWDVRNIENNYLMFYECPIKKEFKPKFN